MKYIHWEFQAGAGDTIRVDLDSQANVLLLDSTNYSNYRNGRTYRYLGGLAKVSPCHLQVPHVGRWHVVVDRGGYGGSVRASAALLS